MNDKEKDELNRWCHTVLLGKCWHEWRSMGPDWGYRCGNDCGRTSQVNRNPDYTSSLDLASIVEAKAIERERSAYFRELEKLCDYDEESCITADAPTRCKAARAAVEGA